MGVEEEDPAVRPVPDPHTGVPGSTHLPGSLVLSKCDEDPQFGQWGVKY